MTNVIFTPTKNELVCNNHVIGYSDLVDLWVIKPTILCARSTSRSSELSKRRRSRSENMRKVCLLYGQNNKTVWKSNMADTFEKFTRCAKVSGLFYWLCFSRADWLGRQTPITWNGRSIFSAVLRALNLHRVLALTWNGRRSAGHDASSS